LWSVGGVGVDGAVFNIRCGIWWSVVAPCFDNGAMWYVEVRWCVEGEVGQEG
jgi:hypothetical protein